MRSRVRTAGIVGAVSSIALTAVLLSAFAGPVGALPQPVATAELPVSVVIPDLHPSPTPSRSTGGGTGTGTGSGSSSSTPAPVPTPERTGAPTPPSEPTDGAGKLTLDKETVSPGDWLVATGTGFTAGEKVQFVLYPGAEVIDSFEADETGTVVARFRLSDETRAGDHVVEATGWKSDTVRNAPFQVVGVAGAVPWLWWVLIVLGALLVSLIALAIYFRESIRGWFGGRPTVVEATP